MSQVDSEGHHYQLLAEISDHQSTYLAITKKNGSIRSKSDNLHPKKTTIGWSIEVEWKDRSVFWVPLKNLKASNPIELAEYAVANNIEEEPAFKWWVKNILRNRNIIISKVKEKYWRTTHKFGIEVPKSINEAYAIDRLTGTTFWTDSINKEMKNVRIAFDELEGVTKE